MRLQPVAVHDVHRPGKQPRDVFNPHPRSGGDREAVEGAGEQRPDLIGQSSPPAVRMRRFLSEEVVLCVFDKGAETDIGASHTLAEVWMGERVVVSGLLSFDGEGRIAQVRAAAMKTLGPKPEAVALIQDAQARGEAAEEPAAWDDDA